MLGTFKTFKKKPAYTDFEVEEAASRPSYLIARFNCAGARGVRAYPGKSALATRAGSDPVVYYTEYGLSLTLNHEKLHPHDRVLMTHALSELHRCTEEHNIAHALQAFEDAASDRSRYIEYGAINDRFDIPSPLRAHGQKTPGIMQYRDFSLKGGPDDLHIEMRLTKPSRSLDGFAVFTRRHDEQTLLRALRDDTGSWHFNDQVMMRDALLALRHEKRRKQLPITTLATPEGNRPTEKMPASASREKKLLEQTWAHRGGPSIFY